MHKIWQDKFANEVQRKIRDSNFNLGGTVSINKQVVRYIVHVS